MLHALFGRQYYYYHTRRHKTMRTVSTRFSTGLVPRPVIFSARRVRVYYTVVYK